MNVNTSEKTEKLPNYDTSLSSIRCDRCRKPADFMGEGGCCDDCGDNLCTSCAEGWYGDSGVCRKCHMSASAAELLAVCKEMIRYHEKMDASPFVYEYGFPADLATRLYDAVAAAEGRIEESYGGVIES